MCGLSLSNKIVTCIDEPLSFLLFSRFKKNIFVEAEKHLDGLTGDINTREKKVVV